MKFLLLAVNSEAKPGEHSWQEETKKTCRRMAAQDNESVDGKIVFALLLC